MDVRGEVIGQCVLPDRHVLARDEVPPPQCPGRTVAVEVDDAIATGQSPGIALTWPLLQ